MNLTFGDALEALKDGKKVARSGWNGKGMFIYIQEGSLLIDKARNKHLSEYQSSLEGSPVVINPHIDMKAADGSIVIGWLASQTDMLSKDWMIVE